jgi:hypothetical protein
MGFLGTIIPFARRNSVSLLPGERPMLTPISVRLVCFSGIPVVEESDARLSMD